MANMKPNSDLSMDITVHISPNNGSRDLVLFFRDFKPSEEPLDADNLNDPVVLSFKPWTVKEDPPSSRRRIRDLLRVASLGNVTKLLLIMMVVILIWVSDLKQLVPTTSLGNIMAKWRLTLLASLSCVWAFRQCVILARNMLPSAMAAQGSSSTEDTSTTLDEDAPSKKPQRENAGVRSANTMESTPSSKPGLSLEVLRPLLDADTVYLEAFLQSKQEQNINHPRHNPDNEDTAATRPSTSPTTEDFAVVNALQLPQDDSGSSVSAIDTPDSNDDISELADLLSDILHRRLNDPK